MSVAQIKDIQESDYMQLTSFLKVATNYIYRAGGNGENIMLKRK